MKQLVTTLKTGNLKSKMTLKQYLKDSLMKHLLSTTETLNE
jgi:hypothetical protein